MPETRAAVWAMKIREVRCFEVSGPARVEAMEERQLQMLDVYSELARRGPAGPSDRVTDTYVEVVATRVRATRCWRYPPSTTHCGTCAASFSAYPSTGCSADRRARASTATRRC